MIVEKIARKLDTVNKLVEKQGISSGGKVLANYGIVNGYTKTALPAHCFTEPVHLQVETTTVCNLRCTMCELSYKVGKGVSMSFEDFKRVLSQFPHLVSLDITGIGEPFCNPDFSKMLRFTKQLGLSVVFNTNGVMMKEEDILLI